MYKNNDTTSWGGYFKYWGGYLGNGGKGGRY